MVMKTAQKIVDTSAKVVSTVEKISFQKLFFIFLIGSVFGAIYEDILVFIKTWHETGAGVWMLHRGVIYGPFNVVYGFGAAAMCWLLCRKRRSNAVTFAYAALLGGGIEYALSFLQEKIVGTVSWDYHDEFLNINGRTTIPFMVVWGLMGILVVKVIYPAISRVLELIPAQARQAIFWFMLIFMIGNMSVSWSALIRQRLRQNNIPALSPVGEFYDRHYNDDFLRKYFPNMERVRAK